MNHNSEKTRNRILLAAADIFTGRGYRATTIRQICGRANANVAAVNYHFESKAKLYVETCRFIFRDAGALNRSRQPVQVHNAEEWQRELREWIHSLLESITNPARTHIWECRMFSRERTDPSGVLPVLMKEFFLPIKERLEQLLQFGMPPDADGADLKIWSVHLLAQCTIYAQREPPWDELLFPPGLSREEWLQRATQQILDGILCRLSFRSKNT